MKLKKPVKNSTLIAKWLESHKVASTRAAYQVTIGKFFEQAEKPYYEIDGDDVAEFARTIDGLAVATQRAKLACVRGFFAYALRQGYTTFNPAAIEKLPKAPRSPHSKLVSESDLGKIFAAAKKAKGKQAERNLLMLQLLYATGGRISEVLSVKRQDLAPSDEGGGRAAIYGEKSKQWRYVAIPDPLWSKVSDSCLNLASTDLVFNLSRSQAWRVVKKLALASGVTTKASPHWFRHSHATHALEHGALITEVQAQLGHASITTTQIYVEMSRQPETAGKLNQKLLS